MSDKKSPAVPKHVAIIPDGNRRWAKKRGLKPWEGHLEGAGDLAKNIADTAFDAGVEYLTMWAGSYDNLTKRSKTEIRMLNEAYRRFARKMLEDSDTDTKKTKVTFVGEWENVLERETVELISEVETKTKKNSDRFLTILIAYNGDREMVDAINRIIKSAKKAIDAESIKSYLWTSELPPLDLVIRTGGDDRLSAGFMMWDIQYAELYFSSKLWPDFSKQDLLKVLEDYSSRERRFGK